MLRIARLLKPAQRARPWLLYCDDCGVVSPPLTTADARALDETECLVCQVDDADLERAVAATRPWHDRN